MLHNAARRAFPIQLLCLGILAFALTGGRVAADEVPDPLPEDTVVIATGDWLPYVSQERLDDTPFSRAVTRAFERAGLDVLYVFHPWTRNAQLAADGMVDGVMPYYCSQERAEKYLCSSPLVDGEQVFFHHRDLDFEWEKPEDLAGYQIGATLGYYYGKDFERLENAGKIKVLRIAKDATNMRLLMKRRIDLFPQDRAVGYAMIRELFPRDQWHLITHDPKPLHTKALHVLFTRKTERGTRFLKIFNRELGRMAVNGELDGIMAEVRDATSASDLTPALGQPENSSARAH
ncbi:transporter substrate-binding domain-containing protein [Marinobacteraceae bacterium S3BR75-40.1]